MDLIKLFLLSLPLILAGLVQAAVGFFVTLFLARYGTQELAAGAVVTWVFTTLMTIVWGTLSAIGALVAIKRGENDEKGIGYVLRDGILLALLYIIPSLFLLWLTPYLLIWFGQEATIIHLAKQYIFGLIWGIPADFIGLVLLQFLIGLGQVRINLVFALVLVPLNIFLNYALLFGKFGFPALGIAGVGWGTTFSFWITTLGLFMYLLLHPKYNHYFVYALSTKPPSFLKKLSEIGIPTGFMFSLQVAFFLVITLFMGHFGVSVLAANQITLQYGWLSFVILYATAQAVTVRVGNSLGEKNISGAERICYHGIIIALFLIVPLSFCYWFFPEKLIDLDLDVHNPNHAEIVYYAKTFLALAGIFQLLEAVRIIFFGALRGLKDTHFSFWSSSITYWLIALPLGYSFAIPLNWGAVGLWVGITLSGIVSVGLLYWRFFYKIKELCITIQ